MRVELVLVLVVFVSCVASSDSDGVFYYEQYPSETIRDKRTLGVFLQSFADALGYDVQKRPSVLPLAPAVAAPAPKAPAAAPAPAPAPAAAPKAPVAPPAAPVPAPKAPVPAPKAPAAPPAAPAPKVPAAPVPAPAPPAPKSPVAPLPKPGQARPPTAPPLLTETIQKMFNINFNWNRNVQPSAAPAPKPGAAPPAPPAVPAKPPAPLPPAPAPKVPAPAPKIPVPAPKTPAAAPKTPITPPTKAPPKKYQNEDYQQENIDYLDPQQIIYYPDYQETVNQQQEINQVQDYDFPKVINAYWQNSPWNKNNAQVNNAPDYQEYVGPDGERGYHVRHYQQNSHLEQQNAPEEQQQVEQTPENVEQQNQQQEQPQYQQQEQPQYQEQQFQQQQYSPEDGNPQSSKEFFQFQPKEEPRGFKPVYHGSESRYQTGYYRPGLPLSVHGIHEDKVLVAWPSPFESAESEIKKKIASQDRIQAAGSEQQEYNYKPDSYDGFSFYEVPEPKSQYNSYKPPADPKIEDDLSPNAKVSEQNYGTKYTNVRIDRNTRHH